MNIRDLSNLSDDEILAIYDDVINEGSSYLISSYYNSAYGFKSSLDTSSTYTYDSSSSCGYYDSDTGYYWNCYTTYVWLNSDDGYSCQVHFQTLKNLTYSDTYNKQGCQYSCSYGVTSKGSCTK